MNKRLLREMRLIPLIVIGVISAVIRLYVVLQATLLTRVINAVFLKGQPFPQIVPFVLLLSGVIVGRTLLI